MEQQILEVACAPNSLISLREAYNSAIAGQPQEVSELIRSPQNMRSTASKRLRKRRPTSPQNMDDKLYERGDGDESDGVENGLGEGSIDEVGLAKVEK